jgi:putative SOS response-associated peptidase YedK
MCGRYTITDPVEAQNALAPVLDDRTPIPDLPARFNVAPTQLVPIVANRPTRALELARWGMVPSWAKDLAIGTKMINARAESLGEKPAFREAFARRRCLVPADGFFEWQKAGKHKQPYFIHEVPRRPFAFAGLWDRWKQPDGSWLISFTIVTCAPNAVVARLHDRMPVVVAAADWERWLTREPVPAEALSDLLTAPDPAGWAADPVGAFVNQVSFDGPECVESRPAQTSLF